jgi:hypothetical protein
MTKYSTRILLALATVALSLPSLTTLSAQSSPNTPRTIVGEVTDTMCAPSKSQLGMMAKMPNMGHDASSGAEECAKIGARYVLLDNQTGKVYQVDDQARIVPIRRPPGKGNGNADGKRYKSRNYQCAQLT